MSYFSFKPLPISTEASVSILLLLILISSNTLLLISISFNAFAPSKPSPFHDMSAFFRNMFICKKQLEKRNKNERMIKSFN